MILIAWINFIIFNFSAVLLTYFYILSLTPTIREEKAKKSGKSGEMIWKNATIYRNLGGLFEFIMIFNLILWIWFPIPSLDWKIHPNFLVGLIIGIAILIPCGILLYKGIKDAGSETLKPSKDTQLFKGIYKYIRHPQTVGEYPMFIAVCFMINSLFLVVWSAVFIVISVSITFHYEEKDLEKRYGEKYLEYKKKTGAFFPKFWKQND
jgi:protein-S-isoprenylcysteine O-methyltransferase Ste14